MRVGVSLRSGYAPAEAPNAAQWMVERAKAAFDAGLDSLFVGDHHSTGPFPYMQNVAIMGRLLAEWHGRTAGILMLLPLWNPVLAAEQIGTLAAIHDGPFVLQCAVGGYEPQFKAMGAQLRERASSFESSLDVIRRLLNGESVSTAVPFEIDAARVAPICDNGIDIWIGGSAERAIDRAARLGDVFLVGPEATLAQAKVLLDVYRSRCAAHGKEPARVAIRRDIHCGPPEEVTRVAQPIIDAGYRGFDPAAFVIGDSNSVADNFAELGAVGFTDIIIRHLANEHSAVLASFARLADVRRSVSGL